MKNLFRYASHFRDSQAAISLFEEIPFLNGGLFECLDREDANGKVQYLDGFSRNKKKQPVVPNELFFGEERVIDLSTVYGDTKRKREKVRGLIHILNGYKFTIVENTPIEQEIALDPELLGQVFENLLASYNEETRTTARKQTGSFYTPRPIVNYMVTESLKHYLKTELLQYVPGITEGDADEGLEILFSFTEREHAFTVKERAVLIKAIDNCKILDPACGSGAFPMGVLQKLVFILEKLDPHNRLWKQRQIDKATEILDSQAQVAAIEAIERDFNENELDYGRKLYLIENCLYGVDIQPIAIQIAKLRCFISLICDQRFNRNKAKNHGIRPLPNLETKFVAADTLIRLEQTGQMQLASPTIDKLKCELELVRHRHFAATTRQERLNLQKKDRILRGKLLEELRETHAFGSGEEARKVANWNLYDATSVAEFFDPAWMFGKSSENGFDIVIGNPPYMRIQGIRQSDLTKADYYKQQYHSATGSFDLYVIFMERGLELINEHGILNFINPDKWVNASFGKGIRKLVTENCLVQRLISFGAHKVFSACTYSSLVWLGRNDKDHFEYARLAPPESKLITLVDELEQVNADSFSSVSFTSLSDDPWILADRSSASVLKEILCLRRTLKDCVKIFVGLQTSKDAVYFLENAEDFDRHYKAYSPELDERIIIEKGLVKPLLMGDQVHRYHLLESDKLVIFPYNLPNSIGNKATLMSKRELSNRFPLGFKYLKRCEGILRRRENNRFDCDEWYQFGRKQGIDKGGIPKILAPDISLGGNFSYDPDGKYYMTTTLYGYIKKDSVWESYPFWLAILNSSVLWFYLKQSGSVLANGYFRYLPVHTKNFPIPNISKPVRKNNFITGKTAFGSQ